MLASSLAEQENGAEGVGALGDDISAEGVGNAGYIARHNAQMFEEGRSFSGNERDKLFFNRGDGTFADLSDLAGCDSPNDGRAVIACDFDDDGDVDLFVHELQRERHALYRNDLGVGYGSFLKLRLRATIGQWEAIGATVVVTTEEGRTAQVLSRGAGFSSCQAPELIFGLGDADEARVEVRWPGGARETFGPLAANSRALLVEGTGEAQLLAAHTTQLPDPLPAGLHLQVGDKVPTLLVIDSDGSEALLDPLALAGDKPLYLNFWATYCAPCVAELPLLQRMHAEDEFAVVAISMDAPGDLYSARDLFAAHGATFPGFYLGANPDENSAGRPVQELVDLERLPIPTTLVLSPEGVIQEIIRGPIKSE